MGRDLSQSIRGYNEFCRWWSRDERDQFESNELVMKRIPSGSFWAREESPENLRNNIVAGSFMFDSTHVTIRTPDDCFGLKNEDLVEYQGEMWIVVSVQSRKAKREQTMFANNKNCSHFTYIELRK